MDLVGLDGGAGGAVVVAEHLCPLQKITAFDQRLELFHLHEVVVHPVLFAGASGACGVGDGELHLAGVVVLGQQGIEQAGLTGPARGGDDIESALLRHVCTFKR